MSKRGAKFPHTLTWDWTKNRHHYCLPLNVKICTTFLPLTVTGIDLILICKRQVRGKLALCQHITRVRKVGGGRPQRPLAEPVRFIPAELMNSSLSE